MVLKKITIAEIGFLAFCFAVNMFISGIGLFQFLMPTLIIFLVGDISTNEQMEIMADRRAFYAFLLVFSLYLLVLGAYDLFNVFENITRFSFKVILIQLPINLTVLAALFFKIRIRDINWKLTSGSLLLILLVWIFIDLIAQTGYMKSRGLNTFVINTLINIPLKTYYPAFVEEVLFRGLCLSGLIAIGISEDKSNILQALIFGLIHIFNYESFSAGVVFLVVPQMFIGFLIGKIFLNTRSLTPCILLHALIDAV